MKNLRRILLLIFVGLLTYFAANQFRLYQIAYAGGPQPGFTAQTITYLHPGTSQERLGSHRTITVGVDGSKLEMGQLPGRSPSEQTWYLKHPSGAFMWGNPGLGIRTTRNRVPDLAGIARSREYSDRLAANRCANTNHQEQFLYNETLLGRWDSVVVLRGPRETGGAAHRFIEWRVPALGCFTVQVSAESRQIDGSWTTDSFQRLVSLEPGSLTAKQMAASFAGLTEVRPSEYLIRQAAWLGSKCQESPEELSRMDRGHTLSRVLPSSFF